MHTKVVWLCKITNTQVSGWTVDRFCFYIQLVYCEFIQIAEVPDTAASIMKYGIRAGNKFIHVPCYKWLWHLGRAGHYDETRTTCTLRGLGFRIACTAQGYDQKYL